MDSVLMERENGEERGQREEDRGIRGEKGGRIEEDREALHGIALHYIPASGII
jgi:hypothetical protein